MSPSFRKSSTPVTVTVCAAFQSAGVNVTDDPDTVPSVGSSLETGTTTFATGWLVRTTVNVGAPPASVVSRPSAGVTGTPATSLLRVADVGPVFTKLSPRARARWGENPARLTARASAPIHRIPAPRRLDVGLEHE